MKKEPEILYDDGDTVAINKPSGLLVHPDGFNKEPCLTDFIKKNYPETETVGESLVLRSGEKVGRPGIVHRLDRDTSGVLLVAKNMASFDHLKLSFQKRLIEKTYRSFVYGEVKKDKDRIERPIGKSAKSFRLWSAQRGAKGKLRDAVTEYKVLIRSKEVSFLELKPLTGRTHQIRVHMKAINHPVVADPLYAPKHEKILGFDRTALHSFKVKFKNLKKEDVCVEAPLPYDFCTALDFLKKDYFKEVLIK